MAITADPFIFGKVLIIFCYLCNVEATRFCLEGYYCEHGHCCGHGRCCHYYYELWWFWVAIVIIAILGTCWYLHHKHMQRQLASQTRANASPQLFNIECDTIKLSNLPSYEEVGTRAERPPSYHSQVSPNELSRVQCLSPPLYCPGSNDSIASPPDYSFRGTRLVLESESSVHGLISASDTSLDERATAGLLSNEEAKEYSV